MQAQIQALHYAAKSSSPAPGRLIDHMEHGHFKPVGVEVLVLDEADQMFDMGFLPSIRKILAKLPKRRQTLLFSATMPDALRGLAHECLSDPVTVQVDHDVALTTVTHALYPVVEHLNRRRSCWHCSRKSTASPCSFSRAQNTAPSASPTR